MNQDIDKLFIDDEYYRQGITDQDPLLPTPYEEAVLDPLAATTEASPQAYAEMLSGLAKGGVQALGTPSDIIGLIGGLLNMLPTIDGKGWIQPEGKTWEEASMGERFSAAFDKVPLTAEKISKMLEGAGWQVEEGPAQAAELIGEIGLPLKATETGIKKGVKKIVEKVR
jgi:hypothetical protein